jgi:tetratricopeptide (TPR) repeat protein
MLSLGMDRLDRRRLFKACTRAGLAAAAAASLLAAGPVAAQTPSIPPPAAPVYKSAKDAFRAGDRFSIDRQYQQAIAAYEAALALAPDDIVGLQDLAIAHLRLGHYDRARSYLDRAIALSPRRGDLYVNRAAVRHATMDYEGAMADYAVARGLMPDDSAALYGIALENVVRSDLSAAQAAAEQGIAVPRPDYRNFELYAVILRLRGEPALAKTAFETALKKRWNNPAVYINLGGLLLEDGKADAAEAQFQRARDLSDFGPMGDVYIAFEYARVGQFARAEALLTQVAASDVWAAYALTLRAQVRERRGDDAAALADLDAALTVNARAREAALERALLRARRGDRAGAVADLATFGSPADAPMLYRTGLVKQALGMTADADADMARALALDPGAAGVRDAKGPSFKTIAYFARMDPTQIRR